ncbi:MAG: lysylphosphatidylglycerol synthase transmembrane domain-containing protein [bacterium]
MENPQEIESGPGRTFDFGPRRFLSALILALALAIVGAAVGVLSRGGALDLAAARPAQPALLAVALLVTVIDVLAAGLRLHVLAHRISPRVRLRDCVRASLANTCLAGLTPSQAGGGAAQLYVLNRAGLPWRAGVAIGTINFLASIAVLALAGLVARIGLHDALPGWLRLSTTATVTALGLLTIALLALLRWGQLAPTQDSIDSSRGVKRAVLQTRKFLHDSLEIARELFREHPRHTAATIPLTALVYGAKLAFTIVVFRAYCPAGHFDDMIGALLVLVLALYFAPTPGASGLAEGATTAYLAGALGTASAAGFALWWRTLALYVPVVIGGFVILAELARDARPLAAPRKSGRSTPESAAPNRHAA